MQEFFLCVLLTTWVSFVDLNPRQPYELLEVFAGRAMIARLASHWGHRAAAIDLDFDRARCPLRRARLDKRSPFDLNSASGLAFLT